MTIALIHKISDGHLVVISIMPNLFLESWGLVVPTVMSW